jgi:hypothetical protein
MRQLRAWLVPGGKDQGDDTPLTCEAQRQAKPDGNKPKSESDIFLLGSFAK